MKILKVSRNSSVFEDFILDHICMYQNLPNHSLTDKLSVCFHFGYFVYYSNVAINICVYIQKNVDDLKCHGVTTMVQGDNIYKIHCISMAHSRYSINMISILFPFPFSSIKKTTGPPYNETC